MTKEVAPQDGLELEPDLGSFLESLSFLDRGRLYNETSTNAETQNGE